MCDPSKTFIMGTEYDTRISIILKDLISHEFSHLVNPDNVLPHFQVHIHSDKVLTDRDITVIKAVTKSQGKMEGATELLERLYSYENWFIVLLSILREKDVKLGYLADKFEKERKKAFTLCLEGTVQKLPMSRPTSRTESAENPGTSRSVSTEDDFNLDDDAISDIEHNPCDLEDDLMTSDMPKGQSDRDKSFLSELRQKQKGIRPLPDPPKQDVEDLVLQTQQMSVSTKPLLKVPSTPPPKMPSTPPPKMPSFTPPEWPPRPPKSDSPTQLGLYDEIDDTYEVSPYISHKSLKELETQNPSGGRLEPSNQDLYTSRGYETSQYIAQPLPFTDTSGATGAKPKLQTPSPYVKTDYGTQYQNDPPPDDHGVGARKKRSKPDSADTMKKVMNDFSYAETQTALGQYDGWHSDQNDKNVIQTFRKILHDRLDGYYLIWFWASKKRPAICVSHEGKLKTFIIHRRSDRKSAMKWSYYIDKHIAKSSLTDLLKYHKEHGITNMKNSAGGGASKVYLHHPIKS